MIQFIPSNNGHVRPPDTTKHESLGTAKHKDFHIKLVWGRSTNMNLAST